MEPQHPAIDKLVYIGGVQVGDDPLSLRLGNANTHPLPAERDALSLRGKHIVIEARIVAVREIEPGPEGSNHPLQIRTAYESRKS